MTRQTPPNRPRAARRMRLLLMAGTLGMALSAGPALTAEGADTPARALVATLLADAHAADGDREALTKAVSAAFDFDTWARFLLGDAAETLPETDRATIRDLLPGYLAGLYGRSFAGAATTAPELGDSRPARRDTLVGSTFPRDAPAKPLAVEWRVRETEEGPKVIDIMVGGTSFLLTRRDTFQNLLATGGAPALIEHMQQAPE